jgi:Domain of unknown function (DUF3291)
VPDFHLAQVNIARMNAPLDSAEMADFAAEVMRRRHRWFTKLDGAYLALWWVPAGRIPSIDEAKARLARVDHEGPSPAAFTFKQLFPSPTRIPAEGGST